MTVTLPPRAIRRPVPPERRSLLTARELQVLTRMARGLTNRESGDELCLSEDTVKTHARRLFRKLGARDRAHAVAIGYETGLLGEDADPELRGRAVPPPARNEYHRPTGVLHAKWCATWQPQRCNCRTAPKGPRP